MVLAAWQIRDPVQRYAAPGPGRDRERVQGAERRMPHHLVALAGITAPDVGVDSSRKACPLEVLGDQRLRPRHAVVPRQGRVMILLEDGEDERPRRRGNENAVLVVQHTSLNAKLIL